MESPAPVRIRVARDCADLEQILDQGRLADAWFSFQNHESAGSFTLQRR